MICGMIVGGVYKPNPVSVEPRTELVRWNAFRTKDRSHIHLVGDVPGRDSRVSSMVVKRLSETEFQTSSGRVYNLIGEAGGFSGNALYVLGSWLSRYGLSTNDVINENDALLDMPIGEV